MPTVPTSLTHFPAPLLIVLLRHGGPAPPDIIREYGRRIIDEALAQLNIFGYVQIDRRRTVEKKLLENGLIIGGTGYMMTTEGQSLLAELEGG